MTTLAPTLLLVLLAAPLAPSAPIPLAAPAAPALAAPLPAAAPIPLAAPGTPALSAALAPQDAEPLVPVAEPVRAVTAAADEPPTYTIDAGHSSIWFKIKNRGVNYIFGRFNSFAGSFGYDPDDLSRCFVMMAVEVNSIDTGNSGRDRHLRNPDFFDAPTYQAMSFRSTKVERAPDGALAVTGELSLHGVTKVVDARAVHTGEAEIMPGKRQSGFEAHLTIRRSEFGMDKFIPGIADEVEIVISVAGEIVE